MNRTYRVHRLAGFVVAGAGTSALALGCAAESVDDAATLAGVETDILEGQKLVTTVNSDGTWTSNATPPGSGKYAGGGGGWLWGGAKFTGPAGKTRKMGVCLLKRTVTVACNTVADCGSTPAVLPAGGSRYCTAPDGVGTKYCHYRGGAASAWCAGTPANGGSPVAPGTYQTPFVYTTSPADSGLFISYGCFEGCLASDPSSSSTSYYFF